MSNSIRSAFQRGRSLALSLLAPLALAFACVNDHERTEDEPIDDRENEIFQGLYDCSESNSTGYRNGNSFAIKVVHVDGKPVQLATANAYIAMQKRAKDNAGVNIRIVSGFRTNGEQQYLYNCYVNCNCNNCNLAARPGYSNHQSGHALDLNTSDPGVLSWLNNHGDEFGFARTVPSEAWHWEYWGAVDFDGPCGGPPIPAGCQSGHNYGGEFCDDENSGAEDEHDRLKNELGVDFHCADINNRPAYCGKKEVTRAQSMSVLGRAEDMPTNGHPNAFSDDNGHPNEKSLNAAKAYGILMGDGDGHVNPDGKATRNTLAIMMKRMYLLPPATQDYFDDDDGTANEDTHNRVAAAGLFGGYSDNNGGRKDFRGSEKANRSTLAILAVRAHDKGLVPVWEIPQGCIDGNYTGVFCDDDGTAAEAQNDRLVNEAALPGMFCRDLAGSPAFCGDQEATRALSVVILGGSAGMPLDGHPDAFTDDDDHPREAYLNAAKAYGIVTGYSGGTLAKPRNIANRDTLAIILARMYALEEDGTDYFTDDNGSAAEHWHNKVGAAGLFTGYSDGNGGRQFRGDRPATKSQLSALAQRAKDAQLVPVWVQQQQQQQPAPPAPAPAEDPPVDDGSVDTTASVDDDGNAAEAPVDDPTGADDPPGDTDPSLPDDVDENEPIEALPEGEPGQLPELSRTLPQPGPSTSPQCGSGAQAVPLVALLTLLPLAGAWAGRRRGRR